MIKKLIRESRQKGVPEHKFAKWVHRVYGDLVVYRMRCDGILGISFPCVLCRKSLERTKIQWTAHKGDEWFHSVQTPELPKSRPTNKQRRLFLFQS